MAKHQPLCSSQLSVMKIKLTIFALGIFFFYYSLYCEGRRVTYDGVVYSGFKADPFHRVTSHLITSMTVPNLTLCSFNCLKNLECVSFNFGNRVNGWHACELLRTDKYNSRSSYLPSGDFHYFYQAPVS